MYIIKLNDTYLAPYKCAKRKWTYDINNAKQFKNNPSALLEHLPKGVYIKEIKDA